MKKLILIIAFILLVMAAFFTLSAIPQDASLNGTMRLYDCTDETSDAVESDFSALKFQDIELNINIEKNFLMTKNISGSVSIGGESYTVSSWEFYDNKYNISIVRNTQNAAFTTLSIDKDVKFINLNYDYDNDGFNNFMYGPADTSEQLTNALKCFNK